MKKALKLMFFLSLLLLTTCASSVVKTNSSKENSVNNNSVSKQMLNIESEALKELYDVVSKSNKNAELKNNQIIVGDKFIQISIETEYDEVNQGKYIFAAKFDTKITGSDLNNFTIGSIGIGEDRKDSTKTAIDEWINLFGTAFSEMLANKSGIKIENFQVYAGVMGIRGDKPASGWINGSSEMNHKMVATLLPTIKKVNGTINAINLMIKVDEKGEVEGECRINNEVSEELLIEMKKLNWDKGSTVYLFKQFYLIKKS